MAGPDLDAAVAARVCPGNRASTMLLMPELSAYRLGQLLALYEHRTFVEAVLYGINPFDEFGVEYGKTLTGPIVAALSDGSALPPDTDALDAGARRARAQGRRGGPGVSATRDAFCELIFRTDWRRCVSNGSRGRLLARST